MTNTSEIFKVLLKYATIYKHTFLAYNLAIYIQGTWNARYNNL